MNKIIAQKGEGPLELAKRCGGYYKCPKDANGKRLGPLVGYAAKYAEGLQWVGDEYVNFARIERHSSALDCVANGLACVLISMEDFPGEFTREVGFCGAPEGGKALAVELARMFGAQYIFPEKKITALKTATSREVSELVFDRHVPEKGDAWWIVEDVCNNFSTTEKLIKLIEQYGASVKGIVCFLNRSPQVGETFQPGDCGTKQYLVVALMRQIIPEYRQDDPFVAEDIKAGNVIWKPKNEWAPLAKAMADNP